MRTFQLLLIGTLLIYPAEVTARTLVVPDNYPAVQQAIDAARPGDTVRVKAGVYEESLTFTQGINLVGEGRDTVTIRCDAKKGPVLSVTDCSSGTISGLTFEHSGAADLVVQEKDRADLVIVQDSSVELVGCAVQTGAGHGISVKGKGALLARDCAVRANAGSGILVSGKGATATINGSECVENKASGIEFGDGARGTVEGNTCTKNESHGIAVHDKGTSATLRNNRCSENKRSGVYFGNGTRGSVTDSVIINNGEINEGEIAQLLESEQFSTLETIASELRAKKSRFPSGVWQLKGFYAYLKDGSERLNFEKKEPYLAVLQRWQEAYPESVIPRIMVAEAYTEYAWEARGHGWASEVTEEGWKGFRDYLTKGWNELKEAEKLETKDPQLYSIMVLTGMGLNKDRPGALAALLSQATGVKLYTDEIADAFEEGVKIEPAYYHLYFRRAVSLLPRWGGGPGEVELFAARAVELTRDTEGEALYAVIAYHVCNYVGTATFVNRFHFSWPRIKQGHIDLLERFPESNYRLNSFCLFASLYKDRETARELFDRIGEDWYRNVWKNRGAFDGWRDWAYGRADWPGPTPLHYATNMGHVQMTYQLVTQGENVNARDPSGWTPLFFAVYREETEILKLLLAHGADVNIAANDKRTPLHAAVEGQQTETVKLLLEHGADVNAVCDDEWTPLCQAAHDNMVEIARMLVEHGADVNIASYNGWSPLMHAARNGNVQLARLFLDNGADVNQRMVEGWSALHIAAGEGFTEIVELILGQKTTNVNIASDGADTPLHKAAERGHDEIVRLLLGKGADVNARNGKGRTPLTVAKRNGRKATMELLRTRGGVE